jgi:hypothetical protein
MPNDADQPFDIGSAGPGYELPAADAGRIASCRRSAKLKYRFSNAA